MDYGKYAILLFSPQGIESIKSEMEDIGEPLVDINFGHGRYSNVMKLCCCCFSVIKETMMMG